MTGSITKTTWGVLSTGEAVDLFTLGNAQGLKARIATWGATLVSLEVPDQDGHLADIVLGFDSLAHYERNRPYFGSTVGRFANRIRQGHLALNNQVYQLAVNNGPNHLHGGNSGYSHRLWQAKPVTGDGRVGVRLHLQSPDGDEHYPGNLAVEVTYWLSDDNSLQIDYRASSDALTPVNLTNHSYFNLKGEGSALGHQLQLKATRFTPTDASSIPTGELAEVAGTPMDFTRSKPLGQDIALPFEQLQQAGGYDHNYVLDGWDGTLQPFARVEEPTSGRVMTVATTCPGVQLYTGNFIQGAPARHGGVYQNHDGFCLETQFFPDSPNQPHFPSCLAGPGQPWSHSTRFSFGLA